MTGERASSVSERVKAQYERHIYPPPLTDLNSDTARNRTERGDPKFFAAQFWPEGKPRNNLRILSAGCGSSQAAHLAFNNPDCTVIGIDLSETSLAHEQDLADKHGLKNLRLERRNILDIADSAERYDLIVCTGVVHHMARPEDGLRALGSVLSPQGAIYAMVYATARRAGVYLMQDLFRRLGVNQDDDGIACVRKVLNELPAHHYARWFLRGLGGEIDDAELVDIFLHVQDRAYSVQEVLDLASEAGLAFQGWSDNGLYTRDANIAPTSEIGQRLGSVSEQDEWSIVDDFTLNNMRHSFVLRHASDNPPWRISFEGDNWLRFRPVLHPMVTSPNTGKFQRGHFTFSLAPQQQMLLQSSDGQTSIAALAGRLNEPVTLADKRAAARDFFRTMWRLGHMFFLTG